MILVKTEIGHRVLKDRSVLLPPRQRSAFILFDGKRSVGEVLASGLGVLIEDVERMIGMGLLQRPVQARSVARAPSDDKVQVAQEQSMSRTPMERYLAAYPVATRLTASLGLRGFRLNLQVEGALNYEALRALAPKIREAIGIEKCAELDRALGD